jgi:hypothetical protein
MDATAVPGFGAGPQFSLVLAASGAVLCVLWGVLFWKELSGIGAQTKRFVMASSALLAAGFIVLGLAYR